jgi:hypothetical protein
LSSVSTNTYYIFSLNSQYTESVGTISIQISQGPTFNDAAAFSLADALKSAFVGVGDATATCQVAKSSDALTSFTTDYTNKTFS